MLEYVIKFIRSSYTQISWFMVSYYGVQIFKHNLITKVQYIHY